jgi:GT2 family glycosyltransferase/ubiquinone/menaquinone biosynthesis C-methylase UbiE
MDTELERLDLSQFRGRIAYEHVHRYALCSESVAGKRVLDLACGTGYGSALLAQAGAQVTAVDISPEAIRVAKARYGDSVTFLIADCYDLPFAEGSFDVVVANEMIEHVDDHDGLIAEGKRVLTEGGLFLVSTPNKPVYNRYKAPNVFHVSEMDTGEFRRLLMRHFREVHLTGTRMALVSVGYDLEGPSNKGNMAAAGLYRMSVNEGAKPSVDDGELWLQDAEYVLAACSDKPFEPAAPRSSLFYSREDDLWLEHEKIMAWASQLHKEDEGLRADLALSRETVEGRDAALARARDEKSALEERIADLRRASDSVSDALLLQREGTQREFGLVSRLLGRVSGSEVPSDSTAMVESLFDLGGTLAQLRTQVAELEPLRQRLTAAEQAEAQQRAVAEALKLETARARDELAASQTAAQAAAERSAAALELARAQFAASRDELRDAQAQSAVIREELEKAKADLDEEQARATLERQARAAAQATARHGAIVSSKGRVETDPRHVRSRERFDTTHRRVRAALQRAPQAIQGRLAGRQEPPAARTKAWKRALVGLPADPFHTAIFDPSWIATQAPDLQRITLGSFLANARARAIDPHPLFAAAQYLANNYDVAVSGMAPLEHYVRHGWREGRNPHPLFANDWYLEQNPDVLASGRVNPLDHYLQFGWHEGRWPNPVFDPRAYLDRYPDIEEAGVEPLTHFIAHGLAEGRDAQFRAMDPEWRRFLPSSASERPLIEYLLTAEPAAAAVVQEQGNVAEQGGERPAEAGWPPRALEDYWPPQTLRDFVIDGYGEEAIDLYWYLYSVMNAYSDRQEEFAGSSVCAGLIERAKHLASAKVLPIGTVPDASVIVPVYNNILDTLLCIVSLLETSPDHSFEIIVADDGSTDATAQVVTAVGGVVRYLRQPRNYGFLGNCNEAAKQATGRYVVLLNNDTLVLPRWLDDLLMPFDQFANVGLTGSKLVNWDGSLQEAGGIFWRDGSAWNFGRGQNAHAPEFNYVKDVDYISGASIAIPTALWQELCGFDPAYTPAYCEDSDIAFRLRDAGYRTLYSPGSEVIHHEGRSHGRDLSSGIKAYQTANQQRLLERWLPVLERDHYPNGQNVLRARDRSFAKRHMLIVDHYVPQFDRDAGSRTIFEFIQTLLDDNWSVTFWPDNLWRDPDYTPRLQQLGVEVIFGAKYRNGFESFLRDREGLYDAVLLSRPHIAKDYIAAVRALTSTKVLYYGHDIHFRRMTAQAKLEGKDERDPRIAEMKALELSICNASHVVLYPSDDEARTIAGLIAPTVRAEAIPAYRFDEAHLQAADIRIQNRAATSNPLRLLFVGGFKHQPNVDGIVWFCDTVAPLLRANAIPFELKVVGSNPNETVMALAQTDVDVVGFVSDETLDALYREADVVVAPLRYGAGVKGKVVEAMARGVPVVTTDVGAQGIDPEGAFLFIGNEPQDFSGQIALAADVETARPRATQAVSFVRDHYSQDAMKRMFQSVLD